MIWQGDQKAWYFTVQPDPTSQLNGVILPDDVVSLTVEEEIQQMPHGTIKLRDPTFSYARILKTGTLIDIAWGWAKQAPAQSITDLSVAAPNIDRIGFQAMVLSPSGDGQDDGDVTYGCNFMATNFRGNQQARWWRSGTKAQVVVAVMAELGIVSPEISFARGNEAITPATAVGQQFTTDFLFLVEMALEWEAIFLCGFDRQGNPRACFVDPSKVSSTQTVAAISGSTEGIVQLQWKVGASPNVLSYHWQDHSGESGTGDGVQVIMVNGQIQLIHRVVGTDTVQTWTFRPERVDAAFQAATNANPNEPLSGYMALFTQGMTATKLSQLQKYFDVTESKTAPQGVGYTITGKMLGNTAMTPGIQPVFGPGFPDQLTSTSVTVDAYGNLQPNPPGVEPRPTNFYCQKATHTVDQSGYMTEFEIVDAYALSDIGQPVVVPSVFGLMGG